MSEITDKFPDALYNYEVTILEIPCKIQGRELADLKKYGTDYEDAMSDFLDNMSLISSLTNQLQESIREKEEAYENAYKPAYKQFKLGIGLSGGKSINAPSDSLVDSCVVTSAKGEEIKKLRSDLKKDKVTLVRLNLTFEMIKTAWETARSLNATERKLIHG